MRTLSTVDIARRWRGRRSRRGDRGETLIELLVSVLILSTAVVAVVGALAVAIQISDQHRKQATAGAAVRAFAEALETRVATPAGYVDCATSESYADAYTSTPVGYTATMTAVAYWDGTTFVGTCTTDTGIQRVSLQVASSDGRATETLDAVLRKPCRPGVDACDPT